MSLLDLVFTCSYELLEIMKMVWNCELWLVMVVNDSLNNFWKGEEVESSWKNKVEVDCLQQILGCFGRILLEARLNS